MRLDERIGNKFKKFPADRQQCDDKNRPPQAKVFSECDRRDQRTN